MPLPWALWEEDDPWGLSPASAQSCGILCPLPLLLNRLEPGVLCKSGVRAPRLEAEEKRRI